MIINQGILDELYLSAGNERAKRAEEYVNSRKINIKKVIYEDEKNFEIRSKVKGSNDIYNVHIQVVNSEIEDISCTCEDYYKHYGTCKHILATAIEFDQNESYVRIFSGVNSQKQNDIDIYKKYQRNEEKYRNFRQLINTFYPNHTEDSGKTETKGKTPLHTIKLEPELIYNSYLKTLKLEVKIGDSQFYKIKNFSEFYDKMKNNDNYKYGAKLEFVHNEEAFEESSKPLLNYILKYSEIIKYANSQIDNYSYYSRPMEEKYITISNTGMEELFEILQNRKVTFQRDGKTEEILFLKQEPDIKFNIEEEGKREYKITPNIDVYGYEVIEGRNKLYLKIENILYECNKDFKDTTLKLLQVFRNNFVNQIVFPKEEMPKLFSVVFPKIKEKIQTDKLDKQEIEKYIPKELFVKVFLDYNENNYITADIKFVYGEEEFNPLLQQDIKVPRDVAKEDEVLELFRNSEFMLDTENAKLILVNEEAIYQFLETDIETYMKRFEVLATDNFKQKEIRKPKIESLGVRIENNLLDIDLSKFDFDINELKDIMQKYHLKKKYHRLKDGSFLKLDQNETMDFIDNIAQGMDISYKEIEKGQIRLPIYRSLYLNRLLDTIKLTNVRKNEEYDELIEKIENKNFKQNIELPKNLNAELRNYQNIGFEWLKALDSYGFGGILADDMGLRKNFATSCSYSRLCSKYKKERVKTKYCSMPKLAYSKLAK